MDTTASITQTTPDNTDERKPTAAELIFAEAEAANEVRPYTTRGAWELACMDLPPCEQVWNGITLAPLRIYGIAGAPAIGKSRLVTSLAIHQVLGFPFLGLPTLQRPLRWLLVGTENDVRRQNFELCRFLFRRSPRELAGIGEDERRRLAHANGFTDDDLARLDDNFRPFTLEAADDADISLADERNRERLVATLKNERPDVIVVDPWGDFIAGEELNDADVRETIRLLRLCETQAHVNAPCIIVCHARIGAQEEAKAAGMDAGNFMKNSKALYSITRTFYNIRRASFDEHPPLEIICSKCNDGLKLPPVAGVLNPETMSYELLEDFDHEAWQTELELYARTRGATSGAVLSRTQQDVVEAIGATLEQKRAEARRSGNEFRGVPKAELYASVAATFAERNVTVSEKRFRVFLASAIKASDGLLAVSEPHDHRREYIGTPHEIAWVAEAKAARRGGKR